MKTTWAQIKSFVDNRSTSIQYIESDEFYDLVVIDGYFILECRLLKNPSDTSDIDDFETNYKSNGNKSPTSQVITQFEKRDKTLKLAHTEGDVDTETGLVEVLLKIPGTPGSSDGRWISSGTAFFDIPTAGDKVLGVYFTDEDNILEGGAGTVVGSYTDDEVDEDNRGWVIPSIGFVKADAIGGYGFAPAGFYIKVVAKKAGESPSGKFYCNFEWAKTE